ncbi:hypothetical protein GUJ93_ZPchr0011g27849 [Zizania palustris]|uniref:Uncharacterized protein n=1 Tax=Zizania palustris TaxID=103762 RepID=A0A8J6BS96_ZIZPA|nr:hypothetical protein GUJ93_ZPchr0011g27849 [Zizania palustris]
MDVEVPSTTEALDDGMEVERSEPKVEAAGSEPRAVATDAEAVHLELTPTGLDSEGLQARKRDFGGLFKTSEVWRGVREDDFELPNAFSQLSASIA